MKNRIACLLALICLLHINGAAQVRILTIGDSTMADYDEVKNRGEKEKRGWAQMLPHFLSEDVKLDNAARNGRSSKSFYFEFWESLRETLKSGDYVVIQFGHNDEKNNGKDTSEDDPKERGTAPWSQYQKYLKKYITESRERGAIPVLVTPVVRGLFNEDGKTLSYVAQHNLVEFSEVKNDSVMNYVLAMKSVAREMNVPLVDMTSLTKKLIEKLGPDRSKEIVYCLEDNTHLKAMGGLLFAQLFAQDMVNQGLLTKYIRFPKDVAVTPDKLDLGCQAVSASSVKAISVCAVDSLQQSDIQLSVSPPFEISLKPNSNYISKVWVSDLGNGKYKNPVLYADYSDPDVCRVGDDYYMTASSFNCIPGLPILHSKDLVNWTIIGHAITRLTPDSVFSKVVHGGGVWAPAIRYHKGEFYIYYGDPDQGIFMTKTRNPAGEWEPLVMVKEGKGLIDACPLFDNDGQVYLAHAYAGSRAGIKSLLAVTRLTPDGKKTVGESRIIYDGHDIDPTIEGPKFYKRNGYYYIFAPAGGVATGWQLAMRSKDVFGPYERKIVMDQGKTAINGPHQGAWVDTSTGEDWFFHFQDVGALGRLVHLQPMIWKNDWPVIGEDKDGDGCGNPILTYKKPNVGKTYPIVTPVESDEFSENSLGLQWQWYANPMSWWYFTNKEKGCLSLYSVPVSDNYKNLWNVPNLLLQKMPAPAFTATMKLTLKPDKRYFGERTGLLVMGLDYALLSFENTDNGFVLSQAECLNAEKGTKESVNESVLLKNAIVYLRMQMKSGAECTFSYSIDNKKFIPLGKSFIAKEGKWIGAKIGTFCTRPISINDGGRADIDWFRVEN